MKGSITLSPDEVLKLLQEGLNVNLGGVNITSVRFYSYEDHKTKNLSDFNTIDIEFGEEE
jgi:hypothetical protein